MKSKTKTQIKTKKHIKKSININININDVKKRSKKNTIKISYNKNSSKKGGSNMNDVDIDEIGDVADALDLKGQVAEYFGSGQNRGIFDSLKVDDGTNGAKRNEMPQLECCIL